MNDLAVLKEHADNVRKLVMEMAYKAQSAHTGGSLSCVDFLTVLYFVIMKINPKKPLDKDRDRLIFSKAHDCKALYAVLAEKGFFNKKRLKDYEKDGGLPGHSARNVLPGIEISAGSLGHGLSIASGIAYARKLEGKRKGKVFVVLSDGECEEGSTWEGFLFAGHHKLDNLTAVIDYNKIQAFGRIDDVLSLEPFKEKLKSFNWEVKEANGHDLSEVVSALKIIPFKKNKPSVLIAHTIKGYKGVAKYVDKIDSHYKPPTEEEYKKAIEKLL
jgi:transketolase